MWVLMGGGGGGVGGVGGVGGGGGGVLKGGCCMWGVDGRSHFPI